MNTRQKLTLGIVAIFMVTLTIVGVTYAYFVTRVTGDENTPVDVKTATLGDVRYVPGNDGPIDEETQKPTDIVSLTDVLPGQGTVYKKFAVTNENEDANALSYFSVITTNTVTADKGEFIHTADGKNSGTGAAEATDVLYTCYGYKADNVLDANVIEPKRSTENAPELCFVPTTTGASIYNNIKITLWEVAKNAYDAEITADPVGTVKNTKTQLTYNATDVISDRIEIAGNDTTKYYVLKVEYLDAGYNQNAENLAGLDVLVSIQAA